MSEQISLNAENREIEGKSSSRLLRRGGSVPAIIYGGSKEPLRISILENLALVYFIINEFEDSEKILKKIKTLGGYTKKSFEMMINTLRKQGKIS